MNKKRLLLNSNSSQLGDLLVNEFDVVLSDRIRYKNKLDDLGFDAYLLADSVPERESFSIEKLCDIAGIKVIGTMRYAKSQQHLILRSLGINSPDTYFITGIGQDRRDRISDFSLVELLIDIPNDAQLIAKMNDGARGVGQLFIQKDTLLKYALNGFSFDDRRGVDEKDMWKAAREDEYSTKLPEKVKANSPSYILPLLSGGGYIIQRYVDVKSEFRYLYFFGEDPIVIERGKVDGDWQANSCVTGKGTHLENPASAIPNFDALSAKVTELAKYLNAPFLSVDVYLDQNDNFGIFEFQMEFGIMYVPHNILLERINKSIHNKLNDVR